jgi:hypothetical protein
LESAFSDDGKIAFQAAPTLDSPVNFSIDWSTIPAITEGTGAVEEPLSVTAFLLKLTTTLPGHLLPGPGVKAADLA